MIVFGPVPSRRLGRSLGINNIPPKHCTYSCIYCQLDRTGKRCVDRQTFWRPDEILAAVQTQAAAARDHGEPIDYLTFVPDGEPTLDINLGQTIAALRPLGLPIAVISNGSLITRDDVRQDLASADWVSLKIDAASEKTWRRIDRPAAGLDLDAIVAGMRSFARTFTGELATETMLLANINDSAVELQSTATLVGELAPAHAYLSVPTRPPAERWVKPADEAAIARAYEVFSQHMDQVELLLGYEGDAFAATGNARDDLLSITAVHPMREGAVKLLLERDGADWDLVTDLLHQGQLVSTRHHGHRYFVRPIKRPFGLASP